MVLLKYHVVHESFANEISPQGLLQPRIQSTLIVNFTHLVTQYRRHFITAALSIIHFQIKNRDKNETFLNNKDNSVENTVEAH